MDIRRFFKAMCIIILYIISSSFMCEYVYVHIFVRERGERGRREREREGEGERKREGSTVSDAST